MSSQEILHIATSGSVDDGKSSLIGRILYETDNIFVDQLKSIEKISKARGLNYIDYSLLLDGLQSEREQGITIDVAYRYFSTQLRKFIIADSPGHKQYTRNMVTGASNANLAIILIDATKGITEQSKRHAFIISLLQVPHVIVAINKMDLVDNDQEKFNHIQKTFLQYCEKLDIKDLRFIPVSAIAGTNIKKHSDQTPWYKGETLIDSLERVTIKTDRNLVDLRLPIQMINLTTKHERSYLGNISSGALKVGEKILVLPSKQESTIKSISLGEEDLEKASAGDAISIKLNDEIDISRGDMIVRPKNIPNISHKIDAMICWMDEKNYDPKVKYIIKHTTHQSRIGDSNIDYIIDVETLSRLKNKTTLSMNEIARIKINCLNDLFFDSYKANRETGSFILIDPDTFKTCAAGMIRGSFRDSELNKDHLFSEDTLISKHHREAKNGLMAKVFWLTGLSGSGKSTLGKAIHSKLFQAGFQSTLLDGDNVRQGLCKDLSFSKEDRSENIRRIGEVAKLLSEQGNIVICTFISPYKIDRDQVRSLFDTEDFHEIFVNCDIEICKSRDPKGLYQKAVAGEIKNFTGVSAPYEEPVSPEWIVDTTTSTTENSVEQLFQYIIKNIKI